MTVEVGERPKAGDGIGEKGFGCGGEHVEGKFRFDYAIAEGGGRGQFDNELASDAGQHAAMERRRE